MSAGLSLSTYEIPERVVLFGVPIGSKQILFNFDMQRGRAPFGICPCERLFNDARGVDAFPLRLRVEIRVQRDADGLTGCGGVKERGSLANSLSTIAFYTWSVRDRSGDRVLRGEAQAGTTDTGPAQIRAFRPRI